MRPTLLVPIALAALVALLPAPPGAAAEDGFRLQARDLEVLPVHDVEWIVLARDHPRTLGRMLGLVHHIEKVYGNLVARDDRKDAAAQALVADVTRTTARLADLFDDVRPDLASLGVDDEVLAAARWAPAGRLRPLRHALRLVDRAPDRTPAARALHARLVPAVEGALLALDAAREAARKDGDEETATRLAARADAIEGRFWRVVDATLDREARIWLRRRLPNEIAKIPDLLGHVFVLEGLEPSQVQRLRALLVEVEAANAPDQAVVARAARDPTPANLAAKGEAELRMARTAADAWERGLAILTPDQVAELRALPPRLSAQARVGDLKEVLAAIELTPEQQAKARELGLRYGPVKGRLVERLAAIEMRARGASPDGVEPEAAEAARLGAYGEALAEARRAAREVFGDLLASDQVLAWVLG